MSGTLGAILGTGAAGGWAERVLRPASLRGRGFWIVAAQDETARRWVTHEFAGRDDPWHEDLGAKAGAFEVSGLLIGDDVTRQAMRFRAAAGAAGPARLVHPWYGTIQVVVLNCGFSLDANEGRIARFRLQLERLGSKPAPSQTAGLIARVLAFVEAVQNWIDDAVATVQDGIAQARAIIAIPDQLIGQVIGIASSLAGVFQRGISGAGLISALSGTAAGKAIASLAALSPADAADPAGMVGRVGAVTRAIAAEAAFQRDATGNQALAALLAIAGLPSLVAVPTNRETPALASIADRIAFIAACTRLQVAIAAAAAATEAAWDSREAALAQRDALADALGLAAEDMAALGYDNAWRSALALRAAAVADITERAASLPRLRRLVLAVPLPSSLVAYGLDPDALASTFERGTAIAARNQAHHPGFLPGIVEVLK